MQSELKQGEKVKMENTDHFNEKEISENTESEVEDFEKIQPHKNTINKMIGSMMIIV